MNRERIVNLPNALSASRILASPLLAQAVLSQNFPLALGTLLYASASDIVHLLFKIDLLTSSAKIDGYLARRWKQESALGSILDPIGDKLIVGTLVTTLTYAGLFPRTCQRDDNPRLTFPLKST